MIQLSAADMAILEAGGSITLQGPAQVSGVPSPQKTVIVAPSTAAIMDASGNAWTITNGQVAVNGVVDETTKNVVKLAYVGTQVWQKNTAKLWWSKTSPTAAWTPTYGTSTAPVAGT